jgi:L-lactate dehydrogenase complex protein LldG
MTSSRELILGRIRTALGPSPLVPEIPREYHRTGPAAELVERFTDRLLDYRATVHQWEDGVLAGLLGEAGRVVTAPGLPFDAPDATVDTGLSTMELDGFDTALTTCAAAVAETGTIVLDAGPGQGRRAISLIPDRHICLVRVDQIVAGVPDLLPRLDPRRPLTFISGPSATSDIELHRVEGVHGPRTLIVVLL